MTSIFLELFSAIIFTADSCLVAPTVFIKELPVPFGITDIGILSSADFDNIPFKTSNNVPSPPIAQTESKVVKFSFFTISSA